MNALILSPNFARRTCCTNNLLSPDKNLPSPEYGGIDTDIEVYVFCKKYYDRLVWGDELEKFYSLGGALGMGIGLYVENLATTLYARPLRILPLSFPPSEQHEMCLGSLHAKLPLKHAHHATKRRTC